MKKTKFLGTAFLAVTAMFGLTSARGQVKTYLTEDFQKALSSQVWNLEESTKITEEVGPVYMINFGGGIVMGGWVYDPHGEIIQGGIPDPLDGTYRLVTRPITLNADNVNILTMEYMYSAYTAQDARKFGVLVREQGGDGTWETVGEKTDLGVGAEGNFSAALDAKFAGKTVELAVFFTTEHDEGNGLYLFIDNIKFAAYEDKVQVKTEIVSSPYIIPGDAVALKVSNPGARAVESIEYAVSFDGSGVVSGEVKFDPSLEAVLGVGNADLSVGMSDLASGKHTLKMWPAKINGAEFTAAAGDTLSWGFYLVDGSLLTEAFIPMMESFTASTCGPCATANNYLNPALKKLKEAGKINVVKYQMNFPGSGDRYYISGNGTRMQFYDKVFGWDGYWAVPSPIFNGEVNIMDWPVATYPEIVTMLEDAVTEAHARKGLVSVDIKKAEVDANTGKLSIELDITPHIEAEANVMVVVTEKATKKNRGSNGEKEFYYVTMDFPATAAGEKTTFKVGDTKTFTYEVADMNSTHMEEITDLEVVCFVQDNNGYIFQSASSEVTPLNVANENGEAVSRIAMYPNPASEQVTFANLENADVEIFDLVGRGVYTQKNVNGSLQLSVASFCEGTYVVRVSQKGNSVCQKLVIVR